MQAWRIGNASEMSLIIAARTYGKVEYRYTLRDSKIESNTHDGRSHPPTRTSSSFGVVIHRTELVVAS